MNLTAAQIQSLLAFVAPLMAVTKADDSSPGTPDFPGGYSVPRVDPITIDVRLSIDSISDDALDGLAWIVEESLAYIDKRRPSQSDTGEIEISPSNESDLPF